MKTDIHDKRIYRYLLGDLPEEEQTALEQSFLAEGEAFEQVWAVENELIDRYVRGGLTRAEKHLFEQNYLASPVHRERVAFAKDLVQAADSRTETGEAFGSEHSWWNSLLTWWGANRFRWASVAVVVLLTASSVFLFTQNMRLREQIYYTHQAEVLERRIQELEKELQAQREQSDELAAELAYLREEQSPPVEPQTSPDQVENRSVVSFILSPLLMRSSSEPEQLRIPKEINAVLLKMNVQEPDGRGFQATLNTVEGTHIWSRNGIKARAKQKNGSTVSVSIPANKIPPGDYILTLSAGSKANELEEINRYFFRVLKQ